MGKEKLKMGSARVDRRTLDLWLIDTLLDHLCQHAFVEIG
jgi:hypothetical protein